MSTYASILVEVLTERGREGEGQKIATNLMLYSGKKTETISIGWHLKYIQPWLVWLSGLSTGLQTQRLPVPVRFPVRAHTWVTGWIPGWGRVRGNHTLMFFSLSPSLPLSLEINKIFFKNSHLCFKK